MQRVVCTYFVGLMVEFACVWSFVCVRVRGVCVVCGGCVYEKRCRCACEHVWTAVAPCKVRLLAPRALRDV